MRENVLGDGSPTGRLLTLLEEAFHAFENRLRQLVRDELNARQATSPPAGTATEEYVSAARAAEIANVTPATIRDWVTRGRLPGHRAGRLLRIRRSELEAFLAGAATRAAGQNDIEARKARALQRLR